MSTWFSGIKELTDKVQAVDLGKLSESVQAMTDKVQSAIPIDKETIQKLTLTTPEMQAERQQMDKEYKHKIAVKESLSHMLPWETRDQEREILVEECREAIMALSGDIDTFFGPYQVPRVKVNTENEAKEKTEEEELLEEEEKESVKDKDPSPESLEKLAKLEPLPALLANFDLDAHVGLIKKMLNVDFRLVQRQSTLSGGGEREKAFWKNYFFHCAFTRYEAGLSIDELWSDQPPLQLANDKKIENTPIEEEVVSVNGSEPEVSTSDEPAAHVEEFESDVSQDNKLQNPPPTESGSGSTSAEYEIVDANTNDGEEEDAFAGEMDELEAEILKELED